MTEEVTQQAAAEENVQTEVQQQETENQTPASTEPQYTEVELKALEMGWRPKTEFDGNESDFIDAQEFVRRKPLFEKIDTVGRELRETRKALKALQDHHAKVREAEYQHALKSLREEKKAALEAGDADKLIEIDDRIAEEKARQVVQQQQQAQQASAPHPNFVSWVQKNPWYQKNAEQRVMADQIGTAFAATNPDVSPDEVLKYVETRIRKLYPESFTNPNKTRPSAVEGSRQSTPSQSKTSDSDDDFELTDDERKSMMAFVRQNIMTKKQYIDELKRVKGVK